MASNKQNLFPLKPLSYKVKKKKTFILMRKLNNVEATFVYKSPHPSFASFSLSRMTISSMVN